MADIFGSLAPDVTDPLLRPPRNPARMPQGVEDIAAGMTTEPIADAIKALRGQMTPTEAQNFAMTAAMGLITPMARGALRPATQGIRAWHVSPHDYERPDISKIGTGQGAQSYGHGLYGAESTGVRDQYWHEFANKMGVRSGTPEYLAARMNYLREGDIPGAISELQGRLKNSIMDPKQTNLPAAIEILQGGKVPGPKTYEWNINAKPEQFLDWDKPLSRQSSPVQGALEKFGLKARPEEMRAHDDALLEALHGSGSTTLPKMPPDPLGANIYESSKIVPGAYRDRSAATSALREAGIPGIKYLDQGSRGVDPEIAAALKASIEKRSAPMSARNNAADIEALHADKKRLDQMLNPTSNYVLFDDKLVDILRKYGIAGAAGPAAASATFGSLAPDESP